MCVSPHANTSTPKHLPFSLAGEVNKVEKVGKAEKIEKIEKIEKVEHFEKVEKVERAEEKEATPPPKKESKATKLLDELFRKTKTTPCVYWLPLTDTQVQCGLTPTS